MTYQELKDFLGTLSEEQLQQPAVVFEGDEENGKELESWEVSFEDFYWGGCGGDCLGTLEMAKESYGDDWEDEKDELIKIPKGTVTLQLP